MLGGGSEDHSGSQPSREWSGGSRRGSEEAGSSRAGTVPSEGGLQEIAFLLMPRSLRNCALL